MRRRPVGALQFTEPIGKERQRTLGRDARIELAQTARRSIAWVDERFLVRLGLAKILALGIVLFRFEAFAARIFS